MQDASATVDDWSAGQLDGSAQWDENRKSVRFLEKNFEFFFSLKKWLAYLGHLGWSVGEPKMIFLVPKKKPS